MQRALVCFVPWVLSCAAPAPAPEPPRPAPPPASSAGCDAKVLALERAGSDRPGDQQVRVAAELVETLKRLRTDNPPGVARCEARAERLLGGLASAWQTAAEPSDLERAARMAGLYLELFPHGSRTYDLAHRRAEILFSLERWRAAAEALDQVVELDRRGRHAEEAAHTAVIAWGRVLESRPPSRARSGPLPAAAKALVSACDRFLELAPRHRDWVPVLYRKARVYYDHQRYDAAIRWLAEIVTRHPDDEIAPLAAHLLLDSLNLLKRYKKMEEWIERMLASPRLARGELAITLAKLKRGSTRLEAERLADRKQYAACARRYLQLAGPDPAARDWPELIYNAAVCLEQDGQRERALGALERLVKGRPEDALAPRALLMMAGHHQALGQNAAAASCYEEHAKKYPGEKPAADGLETAISLRLGLKHHKQALADAALYQRNYGAKRAERAAHVAFAVGQVYEQQGRPRAVARHYADYLKRWGRQGGVELVLAAHVRIARALWRGACPAASAGGLCGRWARGRGGCASFRPARRRAASVKQVQEHVRLALATPPSKEPPVRPERAEAAFLAAELELERLLFLPLSPGKAFEPQLAARAEALGRARQAYVQVILARRALWAVAAAARIGQLYQISFAALACQGQRGKGRPYLDKALEAFTACGAKAKELKVEGEWPELCNREEERTKQLGERR